MGNKNIVYTLGASNLSQKQRSKADYYGTSPEAVRKLLSVEYFSKNIWEPACGHHIISNVLEEAGYHVYNSDLFSYDGFNHEIQDFLSVETKFDGDIITNPPYSMATEFVVKALDLVKPQHKVAMFLRVAFVEGQKRFNLIFKENPPAAIYVFSKRQVCSKVDNFEEPSAVAYAWFVWRKGYNGRTILEWI